MAGKPLQTGDLFGPVGAVTIVASLVAQATFLLALQLSEPRASGY